MPKKKIEFFDPYEEYRVDSLNALQGGWRTDQTVNGLQWRDRGRWKQFDERTPLCEVPRLWLEFIEPHVVRNKERYGPCWIWQGPRRYANGRSYPILKRKPFVNVHVVRLIADMIWQIVKDRSWFTYQACGNLDCVNPYHIVVTHANPGLDIAQAGGDKRAHPSFKSVMSKAG